MQSAETNDQAECEKHIVAVKNKALFLLKFAGRLADGMKARGKGEILLRKQHEISEDGLSF